MKNIAASRDFKGFDFKLSQADLVTFESKLKQLSDDIQDKALAKALRAGGRVFILEAKSRQRISDRVE